MLLKFLVSTKINSTQHRSSHYQGFITPNGTYSYIHINCFTLTNFSCTISHPHPFFKLLTKQFQITMFGPVTRLQTFTKHWIYVSELGAADAIH